MQIDNCTAALDRADRRIEACKGALQCATAALEAATADKEKWAATLASLHSQVASQSQQAAAQPNVNSLEKMIVAASDVIADMKQTTVVPEHLVAEAEGHMKVLLAGLAKVAASMSAMRSK